MQPHEASNTDGPAGDQLEFIEIPLSTGRVRRFFHRGVGTTDMEVIRQIFDAQHYDLTSFALTGRLMNYANLKAADDLSLLVIDAGANIGASALYFTQLDPRIHVCAIEPEPRNFSVLATNSMGLPITPIEAAVASTAGKLWLSDPGIGQWGFRVGAAGKFQVETITIDDILRRLDARRYLPWICKIDIEGGEEELFRANEIWIDQFPLVIIELHDWLIPGTSNSNHFLKAIAKRNFDIEFRGENMFCFNNDILSAR